MSSLWFDGMVWFIFVVDLTFYYFPTSRFPPDSFTDFAMTYETYEA